MEMNVDNRYIHAGINIHRVQLFFFSLSVCFFVSLPLFPSLIHSLSFSVSPFSISKAPKYFALGYALS